MHYTFACRFVFGIDTRSCRRSGGRKGSFACFASATALRDRFALVWLLIRRRIALTDSFVLAGDRKDEGGAAYADGSEKQRSLVLA